MKVSRRLATAVAVLAVTSVGGGLQVASADVVATTGAVATSQILPGRTAFGVSVPFQAGQTQAQSVAQYRAQFGALPVVRVYDSTPVSSWKQNSTLAAVGPGTSVIYSFQGDMDAIAAGAYDATLTSFLNSRPAGVKVWVVLHHEPEDEIAAGVFTSAQFRAATAHIAPVVRAAGGIPTTILMAWTLNPASGRNWQDYYSPAIDVLGYDAYNTNASAAVPSYRAPSAILDPVLNVSRLTGKPFGFAELGSPCISTDPTCAGRSAWLTSMGQAVTAAGAQFALYWNRPALDGSVDYTLADSASITAWRQQVLTSVDQLPYATPTVSCVDVHCTADGSGSWDADGSVTSYAWNWGDGATSTGATATHDYVTGGTYPVALTVTDDTGGSSTTTRSTLVTHVNIPPVAAASSPSCALTSCSFDGTGSTDVDGTVRSFSWSFGDGTTGTGATPTHRYAKAGTYTVGLTVTDNSGGTATTSQSVTVQAKPIAFRGSSSVTSATATALSVPVPAAAQAGDALLLKVSVNATANVPTAPAGWTELTRQVAGTSLTLVWQHLATANDVGGKVDVQLGASVKSSAQVLAYTNTSDVSPASVATSTQDGSLTTSHTSPSVTVANDDSWVLTLWTDKSSTTNSWTTPAALTVRASTYGSGTGYLTTVLADENGPRAAGTAPARTASTDDPSRAAVTTIVLAPATH